MFNKILPSSSIRNLWRTEGERACSTDTLCPLIINLKLFVTITNTKKIEAAAEEKESPLK